MCTKLLLSVFRWRNMWPVWTEATYFWYVARVVTLRKRYSAVYVIWKKFLSYMIYRFSTANFLKRSMTFASAFINKFFSHSLRTVSLSYLISSYSKCLTNIKRFVTACSLFSRTRSECIKIYLLTLIYLSICSNRQVQCGKINALERSVDIIFFATMLPCFFLRFHFRKLA